MRYFQRIRDSFAATTTTEETFQFRVHDHESSCQSAILKGKMGPSGQRSRTNCVVAELEHSPGETGVPSLYRTDFDSSLYRSQGFSDLILEGAKGNRALFLVSPSS